MAYRVGVVCKNCGWQGEVVITDGVFVTAEPCPVCHCKELTRQYGATGHKEEGK